jgi:glycosyltransferase involved in cell wall biosynthesis
MFPPELVTVIYNGINVELFSQSNCLDREVLGLSNERPVIGTVARLEPTKGIKYLLDAAAIIDKEFPSVYFVIVGDGPEREFLQQYAVRLGIEKKVFFIGFRDDVPSLLRIFDIAVIPSVREGLSIFCLEALAAGCPVVASDVGGLAEIITSQKTGLLVPPKNAKALADALISLLKNRLAAAAFGRKGKEMVEEKFTYKNMVERTMNIYVQVMQAE